MCNFKSAIVIKDESVKGGFRLLSSPWTESHSELETIYNLREGLSLNYAKVEFIPESMDKAYLIDSYKLNIDEDRTPDWFDAEMRDKVTVKLREYIQRMIVTGDVELLIGGQFIIAPEAKVKCAKAMVINAICGGTVNAIWGGTVDEIWGGTVNAIWDGTVNAIWGGTVNAIWGGTVNAIRDGTVNAIRGGTVNAIWGGTVNAIRDGTIGPISRLATVNDKRQKQ